MVKNLPANAGDTGSIPGLEEPLEEEMTTHSSILADKSHLQRSLAGYSPWGHKELDTTEQLNKHTQAHKCMHTHTHTRTHTHTHTHTHTPSYLERKEKNVLET